NDNSSRFGKFIQINFDDKFTISGAEIKTYLLEKSRLVFQARQERNYHIFYQLCAARDHPLLQDFALGPSDVYWYTAQGGDSRIPGVNDREDFEETVKALDLLGFDSEKQRSVFRILKGILLLGNIEFRGEGDSSTISPMNAAEISQLCADYKIDETQLRLWLTVREIRAAGETVRKGLQPREAVRSRDAFAKLLYAQLFSWFVRHFNDTLMEKERKISRYKSFIGVLDIYGFETFDVNSFEQFCINYANEKLQQQFNQHVFKLEQEEYEREELSWVRIDFHDNQLAIDLIEGRPGLIEYLNEQCKVVNGSDIEWLNQITTSAPLKKNAYLQIPRVKSTKFIVKHFAADVSYTVEGFMEKNKDAVSKQLLELFSLSAFPLLREILGSAIVFDDTVPTKQTVKKTVAGQFRDSLRDLMAVLCTTRPHYVRCIKPNDLKERFHFEPKRAIQQLRACGVLETVRISAAGFPTRWTYEEFARRYRVLYPEGKAIWRDKPRMFAEKACHKCLEEGKFALGKTKIFFRTGQVALLERVRVETLSVSATVIQSTWRRFVARRKYLVLRKSLLTIQAATRAFLATRRLFYLQMHRAAIVIQSSYRRYICESRYRKLRCAVVAIQSHFRASKVRAYVQKLRFESSAVIIQKYWRGYLARREGIQFRRKVVLVQCCVRRWLAKRRLRELKIESRSVVHLQKLNTGLENKIIDLQLKLDLMTSECSRLKTAEEKLLSEIAALEVKRKEQEACAAQKEEELALEVERLETECDVKEAQKGELETRIHELTSRLDQNKVEASLKITELVSELKISNSNAVAVEDDLKKTRSALTAESERRAVMEHELSLMRDQLLQNANLLASSHFSRSGSMRSDQGRQPFSLLGPDGNSVSLSGGSSDLEEIALILRQQQMINDLRMSTIGSITLQELETACSRLKLELERLVEEKADGGLENMNVKLLLDRIMEDNDRLREESAELRAMLSTRFERQSAMAGGSPRPDSGHWSAGHSDDGSSDLDEDLCKERQCRQLKALAENLNRVLVDRNREIEKLEKRLSETTPTFVSPCNFPMLTADRSWWSSPPTPVPSECGSRSLADRLEGICEAVLYTAPSVVAIWLAYKMA
ncbi:myosin head, partial [Ostertagia ostertagi]